LPCRKRIPSGPPFEAPVTFFARFAHQNLNRGCRNNVRRTYFALPGCDPLKAQTIHQTAARQLRSVTSTGLTLKRPRLRRKKRVLGVGPEQDARVPGVFEVAASRNERGDVTTESPCSTAIHAAAPRGTQLAQLVLVPTQG